MDEETWRRFLDYPLRKLRIGIASPNHLADVEDDGAAVIRSFRELGDAYEAPIIVLEMGMGHHGGALGAAAKGLAREIYRLFADGGADLRSLKATVKADEDTPTEEINLIDEVLSDKFEIDLPQNEPDQNYNVRSDFLRGRLQQHGNG
jgi:hypothetical protein